MLIFDVEARSERREEFLKEEMMYTYNKRPEGILFDEMLKDAVVQ